MSDVWSGACRALRAAPEVAFRTERRSLWVAGRRWGLEWGGVQETFDGARYRFADRTLRRIGRDPVEALGIAPRVTGVQLLEAVALREHGERRVAAGVNHLAIDDEARIAAARPERVVVDGKARLRLSSTRRDGRRRVVYLDPSDLRPWREEWFDARSRPIERIEVAYDIRPPRPAPPSVPVFDLDRLRQRWLTKRLRALKMAGARFVLHDLQINAAGELFLLMSGPWPNANGSRRLADDTFVPRRFATLVQEATGVLYRGDGAPVSLPSAASPAWGGRLESGPKALRWTPESKPRFPVRVTLSLIETWREDGKPRQRIERIERTFPAPTCVRQPEYLER